MTKPGLFRRLDAGIDRLSCHATIVAIRPPGGCTPSVLGLGAAVPRSFFAGTIPGFVHKLMVSIALGGA